ncbi:hypothetical protein CHH70_19655 [Shouchella clausii]|uniref:Uncharacterized protein n=2 Tax=Shouchella clausii TaxID=79880 RepID=A0A268NV72_SHOCL|nr:hypothetical protein CHH72_19240 [Shouchella clausii]PAE91229.1 hypothetical protein CHH70_19655 [Shouchella clausii]
MREMILIKRKNAEMFHNHAHIVGVQEPFTVAHQKNLFPFESHVPFYLFEGNHLAVVKQYVRRFLT